MSNVCGYMAHHQPETADWQKPQKNVKKVTDYQ
jgi:hypothetical protein